jgi:hypothetical protein
VAAGVADGGGLVILITQRVGRLGNRLFHFGHFVAFAAAHGLTIANPAFGDYADHFEGFDRDLFCRFPLRPSVVRPTPARRSVVHAATASLARMGSYIPARGAIVSISANYERPEFDLDSTSAVQLAKRSRLLMPWGWLFRAYASFEAHAELIRQLFTPVQRHRERVAALIEEARSQNNLLVGIHIRRGDYRQFVGGKYYFEPAGYRTLLEHLVGLYPERQLRFLLCSDEALDLALFAGLNVMTGTGDVVQDLYALANCDLICGPPSTFNMWASFYGRVPRYELESPSDLPHRESFAVLGG